MNYSVKDIERDIKIQLLRNELELGEKSQKIENFDPQEYLLELQENTNESFLSHKQKSAP